MAISAAGYTVNNGARRKLRLENFWGEKFFQEN
jgi:hypothetical protein